MPYKDKNDLRKMLGVKLRPVHLNWVKKEAKKYGTLTAVIENLIKQEMEKQGNG
jgi:hypothetical protein